ncbi:unnamed protein product [Brassica oleracea var. botrytis]
MDLSDSPYLKEIPDLSNATSLEELDLWGCKSLLELTSSIGNATNLRVCNLKGCLLLKELHSSIGRLTNLQKLNLKVIDWGSNLKRSWRLRSDVNILQICLPEKALTSPISLRFRGDVLKTIPDSISSMSGLSKLNIKECHRLVALPPLPGSLLSLDAQNLLMCVSCRVTGKQNGPAVRLRSNQLPFPVVCCIWM